MKNKILKLEDHRPHILIPLIDGNKLVLPASHIENIISGKIKVKMKTKSDNMLLRTIISEWYESLKNQLIK